MSDKRESNLIKNTAILTFGNVCTKGIMFIMTPLFTRWLSQEDYGTFDLLYTYLSLITPILTIDIKDAVFRFLVGNDIDDSDESIISCGLIAHLVSMAVCLLATAVFSIFLPNYRYIIIIYFMMIASETFYNFWVVLARGLKKTMVFAVGNVIYVVAMAISSILLVWCLDGGIYGLMLSYVIGYGISCIYMSICCNTKKLFSINSFNLKTLSKMVKYALPMLPNSLAWWVMNVSDRTIVSAVLGVNANAILSVASKIPNLCQQLFSKFHLSWQETAVESVTADDRDRFYNKIFNDLFKVMASLIILMLGFEFLYFGLLFTEDYYFGYYLTPVLLVAIFIYMLTQFLGGIYIAQMKPKQNGKTTVIAAVVNLTIDLLLVRYIGLWAAVISTFVAYTVLFIIRFIDIRKEVKLRIDKSSWLYIALMLYFSLCIFANNLILNVINMLLSCVCCLFLNRHYVKMAIDKIKNRRSL